MTQAPGPRATVRAARMRPIPWLHAAGSAVEARARDAAKSTPRVRRAATATTGTFRAACNVLAPVKTSNAKKARPACQGTTALPILFACPPATVQTVETATPSISMASFSVSVATAKVHPRTQSVIDLVRPVRVAFHFAFRSAGRCRAVSACSTPLFGARRGAPSGSDES
jgi:hypothetical protein